MDDPFEIASLVALATGAGEDRVAIDRAPHGIVLAAADGAGGMGHGAEAAERTVGAIRQRARATGRAAQDWAAALAEIDSEVAAARGQCAAVVAFVAGDRVVGASVGDCGARLIGSAIDDLTAGQPRKPLIGSGSAEPMAFAASIGNGSLLLATDGLFKYAARERIAAITQSSLPAAAVKGLAELPRLRSGGLPDDIGVIIFFRKRDRS